MEKMKMTNNIKIALGEFSEYVKNLFKSSLGKCVDGALEVVQENRRKIQRLIEEINGYVGQFPSGGGWESYKKAVLKGTQMVSDGCEAIQDSHFQFLDDAHDGKIRISEEEEKILENARPIDIVVKVVRLNGLFLIRVDRGDQIRYLVDTKGRPGYDPKFAYWCLDDGYRYFAPSEVYSSSDRTDRKPYWDGDLYNEIVDKITKKS
jgi:hypothetical protein